MADTKPSQKTRPTPEEFADPTLTVSKRFRRAIPWFDSEADLLAAINLDELSYEELRDSDPEFGRLTQLYERILDKRVVDKTRAQAIAGDNKAQALYTSKMRCPEIAFERFHQSASLAPRLARTTTSARSDSKKTDKKSDVKIPTITADIAEAMIAAGLVAAGDIPAAENPPPMPATMPKITREHYRMLEIEPPNTPDFIPFSASKHSPQTHPETNPAPRQETHKNQQPQPSNDPTRPPNPNRPDNHRVRPFHYPQPHAGGSDTPSPPP